LCVSFLSEREMWRGKLITKTDIKIDRIDAINAHIYHTRRLL
jgi:hypothetical protein